MPEANNKVKYNLKNCHYALLTFDSDDNPHFGTPVRIPGAVEIALDAEGEPAKFYADGIAYYVINNNMGYSGDLTLALIPESFRTDVLHETKDTKGVLIEDSNAELSHFALLFEFDGDQRNIRHVLYNCAASRPGIEGKTNEEEKEVQTETLTLLATPLPDGKVKAKTGNTTDLTVYNNWYREVYMPSSAADLSALTIGTLTLTPEFSAGVTTYTATTENASDVITATAAESGATVTIKNGETTVASGSAATWEDGINIVTIVVSKGTDTKTYTVTVTKESEE